MTEKILNLLGELRGEILAMEPPKDLPRTTADVEALILGLARVDGDMKTHVRRYPTSDTEEIRLEWHRLCLERDEIVHRLIGYGRQLAVAAPTPQIEGITIIDRFGPLEPPLGCGHAHDCTLVGAEGH